MYLLHLSTDRKLAVIDFLAPATELRESFCYGGVALFQGVLQFTPKMPKLCVGVLG